MANITYRQATMADADAIWQIISDAKAVMSIDHNPQWDNGYPSPEIIKADIAKGYAYILQLDDEIVATATLWQEKDVNYQRLQGGRWLYPTKRKPYAVIHRMAVSFQHQGYHLSTALFTHLFATAQANGFDYIRIDTHDKNKKMQAIIARRGFTYRGKLTGNRVAYDIDLAEKSE
ncbi:GNAT family N-acetyltransferase [Weissella confusa]|uniref:GNAT family N-acetyltransferase n=1 Tax=Weissella confusa TaxID=1583 RepID=UPI000704A0D9|nr:GNAT family N-acetyltransferase [Weissella confusa]MBJ7628696.1 GNAT family N-acetyltransferase [Weissella confusa]MBJ7699099.1 GNAT family N-acetyltransferase [Weissella confusa]MBS7551405.1 GNAT family N-acetyltransferase [Weissella confusa]MCQ8146663.1 GNAT family N-acetyltransferase [Weissella confusa]TGE49714.1 N-acetyltransferase [Weissella confusa]